MEIKCPSEDTHLDYLTDETLPSKYLPQVQGALWVTGRAWWDFVSYSPEFHNGSRMFIHRVYRDETYIKRLATEVGRFVKELSGKLGR